MDSRREARDFLQSRRGRLAPPPATSSRPTARRRVPGLRREEVAALAGVSVDYYTRLEKGHLETASFAVLNAVAGALHLDPAEHAHLRALAAAARGEARGPGPQAPSDLVRPSTAWMLDAMTDCPAYLRTGRLDVVASNAMGRALFAPMFASGGERPNLATYCFLDPAARTFFTEWSFVAGATLALLRAETGRHPGDERLDDLVARLLLGSDDFATLWAEHEVREAFSPTNLLAHPVAGELTLAVETQALVADPGLTMVAYVAEPGSTSQRALRRLVA